MHRLVSRVATSRVVTSSVVTSSVVTSRDVTLFDISFMAYLIQASLFSILRIMSKFTQDLNC